MKLFFNAFQCNEWSAMLLRKTWQILSSPYGPSLLKYWYITPGNHPQCPYDDLQMYSANLDLLMWEGILLFEVTATGLEPRITQFLNEHSTIWPRTIWFAPIMTIARPCSNLHQLLFFYGNDKIRNQNLLITRQKPNGFCHKNLLFLFWNLTLLNSSLYTSMIHVCARFYSALLSEIYKPKTKLVRGFPLNDNVK